MSRRVGAEAERKTLHMYSTPHNSSNIAADTSGLAQLTEPITPKFPNANVMKDLLTRTNEELASTIENILVNPHLFQQRQSVSSGIPAAL